MHFPITIVDNFFDDPERIVKFANSLEYSSKKDHEYWPGFRTKPLYEIDKGYFEWSTQKILKCFYKENLTHHTNTLFQKIKGFEGVTNEGWVHVDQGIMAAIIYLDKDGTDGTNFYKPTSFGSYKHADTHIKQAFRHDGQLHKEGVSLKEYVAARDRNNSHFEKTVEVKGLYNRAVIYDSKIYHTASSYPSDKARLTQIFFFYNISSDWFPALSIRKHEE